MHDLSGPCVSFIHSNNTRNITTWPAARVENPNSTDIEKRLCKVLCSILGALYLVSIDTFYMGFYVKVIIYPGFHSVRLICHDNVRIPHVYENDTWRIKNK